MYFLALETCHEEDRRGTCVCGARTVVGQRAWSYAVEPQRLPSTEPPDASLPVAHGGDEKHMSSCALFLKRNKINQCAQGHTKRDGPTLFDAKAWVFFTTIWS